jgi:hypothetical protein
MKATPLGTAPSYHYPSLFVRQKMEVAKEGQIWGWSVTFAFYNGALFTLCSPQFSSGS